MDVNSLHEVNDVKGHETGDQMLKFTGEEFGKCFGKEDTYRIGGDEFVAFAPDVDTEKLEKKIRELEEKTIAFGCFVSIGYETQGAEKINMHTLIKSAEEQMYSNKKAFYQQIQYQRGKENSGLIDM